MPDWRLSAELYLSKPCPVKSKSFFCIERCLESLTNDGTLQQCLLMCAELYGEFEALSTNLPHPKTAASRQACIQTW